MKQWTWRRLSLIERIRWLRYALPPALVLVVVIYQLGLTQALERNYGHVVHYSMEIAFYSFIGPVVTWMTLLWVERKLAQQARLEQQIQDAEREKADVLAEERARIARDLHDGVAQTLYFLALKTDVLRQQFAENERAVSELREVGQTTRHIIRDIRRTIFALRPLDWSESGFVSSLETFIRGFAEQTGWKTTVELEYDQPIPSRLEAPIFRLVQESLNNVAKHAEATEITVSLRAIPTKLTLMAQDNGHGFDAATVDGSGLGLKQMKARVTAVNGIFQIDTSTSGTTVTAVFSINGDAHG